MNREAGVVNDGHGLELLAIWSPVSETGSGLEIDGVREPKEQRLVLGNGDGQERSGFPGTEPE